MYLCRCLLSVSVSVSVSASASAFVTVYESVSVSMPVFMSVSVSVSILVCECARVCLHLHHLCKCVCVRVRACVRVHACVCLCMCVHVLRSRNARRALLWHPLCRKSNVSISLSLSLSLRLCPPLNPPHLLSFLSLSRSLTHINTRAHSHARTVFYGIPGERERESARACVWLCMCVHVLRSRKARRALL